MRTDAFVSTVQYCILSLEDIKQGCFYPLTLSACAKITLRNDAFVSAVRYCILYLEDIEQGCFYPSN